jgi:hypothetical protein
MKYQSIDLTLVIDMFLLVLIGIGPKIALVPFLEVTNGMDDDTEACVYSRRSPFSSR